MNRRIHRNWLALVAGALLTGLPTLALAQNTLSVPNTTASAGDTNVGIPVDYSGPDLTTLAFNVNLDPSRASRGVGQRPRSGVRVNLTWLSFLQAQRTRRR
jgi:hypothetical protein